MSARPDHATAWIVLPGHRDTQARLRVEPYSFLARIYRTVMYAGLWMVGTAATVLVTMFDPFISLIPLFVGAVATYRSWNGRFRVMDFDGACPRCETPIALKPGSKIASPHHLVCYHCHHEPDLYLAA